MGWISIRQIRGLGGRRDAYIQYADITVEIVVILHKSNQKIKTNAILGYFFIKMVVFV